jgi:hypothetical protein
MSMSVMAPNLFKDHDAWGKTHDSNARFGQAAGITRDLPPACGGGPSCSFESEQLPRAGAECGPRGRDQT